MWPFLHFLFYLFQEFSSKRDAEPPGFGPFLLDWFIYFLIFFIPTLFPNSLFFLMEFLCLYFLMLLLIWGEFFLIIFLILEHPCSYVVKVLSLLNSQAIIVLLFSCCSFYVGIIVAYGIVLFAYVSKLTMLIHHFMCCECIGTSSVNSRLSLLVLVTKRSPCIIPERGEVSEGWVFLLSFLTLGWLPLSHEVTAPLKGYHSQ